MTGRLLLLLGLAVAAAVAEPPAPESLGRSQPVDSVRLLPQKDPGTAVLLSLLIPGGGQAYTANYWKVPFIAAAELGLAGLALREHGFCNRLLQMQPVDTGAYRIHRDRRTAFLWWTAGVTVFSMADAYVSAQLFAFDRQLRLTAGPGRVGVVCELPNGNRRHVPAARARSRQPAIGDWRLP
uniref:DUF5683 domain-containing protein n=1 Tax=candidate division WOR-3 bacterium TaxID=2052148 RepID=A0A7C4CB96_UNCW3